MEKFITLCYNMKKLLYFQPISLGFCTHYTRFFMALYQTIRKLRELHQLTQEDMAERTTLSKNGYANIERGECTPSIDSLEKIAHVFGIKAEELIAWQDDNCHISVVNGYVSHYAQNNYYENIQDVELKSKVELLEQQVNHEKELNNKKDEIIVALRDEINLLKEMNELLKSKKA